MAAERAAEARREADKLACDAWTKRMLALKGAAQPSPTLGDALNAGHPYLEVRCLGCDTHQTVALDIVRRPKTTPIHERERYTRSKDCAVVRGYPYKWSHLVALRRTKISVNDPPSTWWPGSGSCELARTRNLFFRRQSHTRRPTAGSRARGQKAGDLLGGQRGVEECSHWEILLALDSKRRPRVVLQTRELMQRRFEDVDHQFAYDEGEGDRSLAYWRAAHERYFTRLALFHPNMMLWCERFSVEYVIEPY
jgi:hypothetical protein